MYHAEQSAFNSYIGGGGVTPLTYVTSYRPYLVHLNNFNILGCAKLYPRSKRISISLSTVPSLTHAHIMIQLELDVIMKEHDEITLLHVSLDDYTGEYSRRWGRVLTLHTVPHLTHINHTCT